MSALLRQSSAPPTLRSHPVEPQPSQGKGRGSGEENDSEGDADDRPLPKYGEGPDYWSDRYTKDPEPFEWLKSYAELQELVEILTQGHREVKVLNIGCGNSLLAEDMYDDGYHHIVNVDNSAVVIEQMRARNQQHTRPELSWLCMDATSLDFPDGQFDVVIDKSLLDTFVCGPSARLVVATYLKEVSRVLTPMGVLLCVSYGEPSSRLSFFEFPHLLFEVSWLDLPCTEGSKQQHYAYVCMKTEFADEMREKYWPQVLEILAPEDDAAPEGDPPAREGNLAGGDAPPRSDEAQEQGDPPLQGDLAPEGDLALEGDPAPEA